MSIHGPLFVSPTDYLLIPLSLPPPFSAAFKRTILIGTCYCFRQLLLLFSLIVVSSLWFESTNYLPNFHTYLSANSDDDGVGAEFAAEDV